jgi:phosphotransferase system IIA component
MLKAMRCVPDHISDERILGDGAFIQFGLDSVKCGEKITKAERLELDKE